VTEPAVAHTDARWREATVVEVEHTELPAVLLRLNVPDRIDHLPGQHYVVRLRADDGYTATRSYSVASAPHDPLIELLVERLDDGEVSGYLADVVQAGDVLEVRGPIGGWFVWDGHRPALAVGGGSGVVPLVAMLRHARHLGTAAQLQLAVSARSLRQLPYATELIAADAVVALTASAERATIRPPGRLHDSDLRDRLRKTCFVCGSAGFAEAMSQLLVSLGQSSGSIRVERFGPSG
jgi:ferredoxin-NADP reductase